MHRSYTVGCLFRCAMMFSDPFEVHGSSICETIVTVVLWLTMVFLSLLVLSLVRNRHGYCQCIFFHFPKFITLHALILLFQSWCCYSNCSLQSMHFYQKSSCTSPSWGSASIVRRVCYQILRMEAFVYFHAGAFGLLISWQSHWLAIAFLGNFLFPSRGNGGLHSWPTPQRNEPQTPHTMTIVMIYV
jgi:hypothetical protein